MECTAQREALLFPPLQGGGRAFCFFAFFVLLFTLFTPIKFYFYPFDALGVLFGACCSLAFLSEGFFDLLSLSLNFSLIPSTRSGRAGPLLFCSCRKVSKRQAQGSFTPLRIPGPKWGAGRPPLETPKSRCAIRIGRTPRRFAAGASVPLGKVASAYAPASAAAPPPLRFGGLRPLAPQGSQTGAVVCNAFETQRLHLCRVCAILKMMRDQPTTKVAASQWLI